MSYSSSKIDLLWQILRDQVQIRRETGIVNLEQQHAYRLIFAQVYNKLRTHHDIRYTLKKIEKPADKVFILIQAILGAINLSDPEYKTAETQPYTESIPILRHICRIARGRCHCKDLSLSGSCMRHAYSIAAIVEIANVRKAGALLKNALEV